KKNYFNTHKEKVLQINNTTNNNQIINAPQLDMNYFHTITEEDKDLKVRMIRIMLDETPDEILKLKKFSTEENWENLRAIAHKMKSSMQFLGMSDTLEVVKSIELSAKEKTNLQQIPEKINRVVQDCTLALQELEKELEKIE
ncbi:MAG: Hpt domain-containing protein, partial [Fimbriimonadaceae bacterium]|nr:Hpt domain-containing protein [Chitinophagales bacterium]